MNQIHTLSFRLWGLVALASAALLTPLSMAQSATSTKTEAAADDVAVVLSPRGWPTQVPVPRNTRLREVSSRKSGLDGFTYATQNFQFNSSIELDEEAQMRVGELFECTFAANRAIAKVLPILRAKKARTSRNRFDARLVVDRAAYLEAGGPSSSVGVFKSQWRGDETTKESSIVEDYVLVALDAMGISKEGKVTVKTINSHTLVHEITHQSTCLNNLPIWINEGMSEYVGYVPFDGEKLDFEKSFDVVVENAKKRKLDFPFSLQEYFEMSQEDMYAHMGNGVDTYMLSTLCVTYFVHLAGRTGVKNLDTYLKGLIRTGNTKANIKKLIGRLPSGKSFEELFIAAWKEKGVDITFAKSAK